jgi:microcompartment protein CcmL/EutN
VGFPSPAIGLLELESIARGIVCADAVVKKAEVRLHVSEPVSPGKYLLLFSGGVAEVEEAFAAGVACAAERLVDRLLLPQAPAELAAGVAGRIVAPRLDALGIVETATVASSLLAADAACKAAAVRLASMRLAKGIGGKGYFTLTGLLADVEAALDAAGAAAGAPLLVSAELVPRPHPDIDGSAL